MAESGALEKAFEEMVRRAVEDGLASLRQQLREELRAELSQALAGAARTEVPVAASSAAPAQVVSSLPAVNQAVSRVLQPTVQADILGAFLQGAKSFAGRCALFARKGDSFTFWRAEGFPAEATQRLRSVAVAATQPGIFKEINENRIAASARRSPESLTPALEQALGEAAEESIYLFPVIVQGRVIAALYADAGEKANSVESAALEIVAMVAGLSLETSAARAASPSPARPAASEAAQPLETVAAPAEAPQAAPFGSFAASVPAAAEAVAVTPPPPDADSLPEAERDIHRRAHRFARVAVQDLLSYHKNKIEEGRQNKNLYTLLREDIEKTRENYQKRFGKTAASSFDYFHYELVVKLAGDDPATLGEQYPGPFRG
ncbi:MAG: hypothetical protein HYS38_06855 [Acidobacteria bacterium]|nr:hypothetical protein [Acidobacteriota bacterium]